MDIREYREQLRLQGIELRPLWQSGDMQDGRFRLACYGAYTTDGEWLRPVIIQELDGGRDGLLTYVGTNGNTIAADVAAILDKTGQ